MTHYLEFKDDKSSKFWMITVDGNTHTVTYGKIGSDGKSSTKEFGSAEEANESAQKLLNSKLKKGYAAAATSNLEPEVMTQDEAEAQYPGFGENGCIGNLDYSKVLVFKGDLHIRGNLNNKTVIDLAFGGNREDDHCELIIVDGDLMIAGSLELTNYYPCLLVLGDLRCEFLSSIDGTTCITGDAFINIAFDGNYNDGCIDILGNTHVPFVFNSDHGAAMTLNPKTICFNYYGYNDDFFKYKYYAADLPKILKPELFEFYNEDDPEEGYDFARWELARMLKGGESPFLDGKAPKGALAPSDIRALANA